MRRSLVHLVPLAAICASCSLVVDLSSLGSDAGDDASVDAPSDAIPDISVDLACTAPPPVVADDQAIFVSGKLGADATLCGTRAAPCATVTSGLTHAIAEGVHVVYLDDSTFAESVAIGPSFAGTIQGGWHIASGQWSASCGTATKIVSPDSASATIDIASTSDVVLRYLTVLSKATGASGESVYATRILDTPSVTLDHVVLVAQNGGAGAAGSTGAPQSGCASSPSNGASGNSGGAGSVGTFGPQGYVPVAGTSGANGSAGMVTLPGNGQCASCTACAAMSVHFGDGGLGDGGTEGGTCVTSLQLTCGGSGTGGCAGLGGSAGSGGSGGGAAVALYTWGATTTVTIDGAFVVGNGGGGGSGGPGANGSPGTTGSPGKPAPCSASCSPQCTPTGGYTLDGGAPGVGSSGGAGGQGGGGSGGPIYLYAAMGGSVVTLSTTTSGSSQFIGVPGPGGPPNGATGAKGEHP